MAGKGLESAVESLSKIGTVSISGGQMTFVVDNLAEKVKKGLKMRIDDDSGNRTLGQSSGTPSVCSDVPSIDEDILDNLESQTKKLTESVDKVVENLTKRLNEASAISVGYSQTYSDAVVTMGEEADEAIKSMYMLIAHCEELDRAMEPVHKVNNKIKHIKTVLSALEAQVL